MFGTDGEVRADPRTIATRALPTLLALGGISAIGGVLLDQLVFTFAIAGVLAAIDATQWWHRWYEVTDQELRVRWGIVGRNNRVVPFGRIQQVDHDQQLVHQVLGLAVLRVETAADAGQTSVTIDAIPLREAERLRTLLLERRAATQHRPTAEASADGVTLATDAAAAAGWSPAPQLDGPGADAPVTVLERSDPQLALAGCTGSGLLAAAVVLIWPLNLLLETGAVPEETVSDVATQASTSATDPLVAIPLLLATALVMTLGAAILSVVQWHGFQLAASDDDLLVRHGLFTVRRLTIPRQRIQQVTVLDNPLRRRLGWCTLRLHSAATGAQGGAGNVLQIPLLRRDELAPLIERLMGDDRWVPQAVAPRPAAARRRAIIRRCAAMALVAVPVAIALRPIGLVALALVGLGVPWGLEAHRRAGVAAREGTATISKGVVVHRDEVVALERLQSTRTSSSPLQRRAHLATLHLDVAGAKRAPTLHDLGDVHAAHLRRTLDPAHA